jgi:hypothetical protein
MIKAIIPDQLLAEWFTKSLLPLIACDFAMGGIVTKEETIEIHKGNLNQPLLKLGSSPSSFREGSLYII